MKEARKGRPVAHHSSRWMATLRRTRGGWPTSLCVCLTAMLLACTTARDPEEPDAEAEVEEHPQVEADVVEVGDSPVLPATPLPEEHGLYAAEDEGLMAVPPGAATTAHPTNAVRGFGFDRPYGPVLGGTLPLFVLWTGSMELSTLRLTRFEPDSLLPEMWWKIGQAGRSGWLPHSMVRLVVEAVPEQPGTRRVRPADTLAPGFYVLHDGSLVGARRRDELTSFYPFQIGAEAGSSNEVAGWLQQCGACVDDVVQMLLDAHVVEVRGDERFARLDLATFSTTQSGRLRRCAERLHAVLSTNADEGVCRDARSALLMLSTIVNGPPWSSMHDVLEVVQTESRGSDILDYWLEVTALEVALDARNAIARRDVATAAAAATRLATLYLGSDSELPALLWVPLYLDAEWERLPEFTARLATGVGAYEELFVLIAAHRARRLLGFAERHPGSHLIEMVEASSRSIPREILDAAAGLKCARGKNTVVHIGPSFTESEIEVDPALTDSLEKWFHGRQQELGRCYKKLSRRSDSEPKGVLLVRTKFVHSFFGQSAAFRVMLPNGPDGAPASFGDLRFLTCVEGEALAGLPKDVVNVDATVTVPIAFNGDRRSGPLIR